MFHLNTERLIDYWRARRGGAPIPRRTAIDPSALASLLPQVFMLGRLGPGQYRVRLTGEFIVDLYGRNLRDTDFARLWREEDRAPLQLALEAVRRKGEVLVVDCEASGADDASMGLEITFAPLIGNSGFADRMIGLFQPTSPAAGLKGATVRRLVIRAMTTSDQRALPRLRLAAANGRAVA